MKILNQDMIIQRLKSDADLLGKNCEFDVKERVLNQLKDIEIIESPSSVNSPKPMFKKILMPLVGAAVLALIASQLIFPVNTMDQTPSNLVSVDKSHHLISNNQAVVEEKAANKLAEKLAIKEDMLFIAQVFSM